LSPAPELVLIDGNRLPADLPCPARALIGGDGLERCIMAASVLAKVSRDRYLRELDTRYPAYGFARHKGYPTAEHLAALLRHGPCPEHRRSYGPVQQASLFSPG
jgi:ribonuclease HII